MTIDIHDLMNSILASLSRIHYIKPEEMPNIDLYMDQVTTFMEEVLRPTKRHAEDKIPTKTMVNNYVKNDLLPPPEKKKYSKEHLLTLIFIYYFKTSLSIQDIQKLLNPITDRYWDTEGEISLEEIYKLVFSLEETEVDLLKERLQEEFRMSEDAVAKLDGLDKKEADFLQKFVFVCLLNFDVFAKKLLMEKIIDSLTGSDASGKKKK